jgi:hypothetical protein
MTVEKAFQKLVDAGADIVLVNESEYIVYNNGFLGLCSNEDPFVVNGDDILEMYEKYC